MFRVLSEEKRKEIAPDIMRALVAEYPDGLDTKFINTKFIVYRFDQTYPVMGKLNGHHRRVLVSLFVKEMKNASGKPLYQNYTGSYNHGSHIFVRTGAKRDDRT
jgi:hypothetical protein